MRWNIKIMESTMILIFLIHGNQKLNLFLIHGNQKFIKVYSAKCILFSNLPKFATAKVYLYRVYGS